MKFVVSFLLETFVTINTVELRKFVTLVPAMTTHGSRMFVFLVARGAMIPDLVVFVGVLVVCST